MRRPCYVVAAYCKALLVASYSYPCPPLPQADC